MASCLSRENLGGEKSRVHCCSLRQEAKLVEKRPMILNSPKLDVFVFKMELRTNTYLKGLFWKTNKQNKTVIMQVKCLSIVLSHSEHLRAIASWCLSTNYSDSLDSSAPGLDMAHLTLVIHKSAKISSYGRGISPAYIYHLVFFIAFIYHYLKSSLWSVFPIGTLALRETRFSWSCHTDSPVFKMALGKNLLHI